MNNLKDLNGGGNVFKNEGYCYFGINVTDIDSEFKKLIIDRYNVLKYYLNNQQSNLHLTLFELRWDNDKPFSTKGKYNDAFSWILNNKKNDAFINDINKTFSNFTLRNNSKKKYKILGSNQNFYGKVFSIDELDTIEKVIFFCKQIAGLIKKYTYIITKIDLSDWNQEVDFQKGQIYITYNHTKKFKLAIKFYNLSNEYNGECKNCSNKICGKKQYCYYCGQRLYDIPSNNYHISLLNKNNAITKEEGDILFNKMKGFAKFKDNYKLYNIGRITLV